MSIVDTSYFKIYYNEKIINDRVTDTLSWSNDEGTLGTQLTFSYAVIKDTEKFPISVGGIISLRFGTRKVFTGIVVDISFDGRNPRQVTCLDFAFYLNKSETTIQFKKSPADAAIKKLLSKYPNIKLQMDNIPFKITQIYKAKTYSDIIKDILETVKLNTGVTYVMEMQNQTLVIKKKSNLVVNISTLYIINPKRRVSIQEMKNKIEVVLNSEKSSKVIASSKNSTHAAKYGLLTKIHEIEKEEVSKAKNIANTLLAELDRISEENEVELMGNVEARSGRMIKIYEPVTGISGIYLITNATHNINGGAYLMNLKLKKVK